MQNLRVFSVSGPPHSFHHHGDEGDDDSDTQLAMRMMGEQRWNEIDKENVFIS